jgi:hypothetical protein
VRAQVGPAWLVEPEQAAQVGGCRLPETLRLTFPVRQVAGVPPPAAHCFGLLARNGSPQQLGNLELIGLLAEAGGLPPRPARVRAYRAPGSPALDAALEQGTSDTRRPGKQKHQVARPSWLGPGRPATVWP